MSVRPFSAGEGAGGTVYLDCAATTPLDPRVRDVVVRCWDVHFGNAGSRTHEFGDAARSAVEQARAQIAAVVGANRSEVVFTSGATESNNLALLGLAAHGEASGRRQIVSTQIEHHAVLEPLAQLRSRGFEVVLVKPDRNGVVDAEAVLDAVRPETLLVSLMHANNETGVIQPINEIARGLERLHYAAYFHVDAAQTFGKLIEPLRDTRIDLISISGHKVHGPQGVGTLIARRRRGERLPLAPLMFGGGQELGLRPGTLPVALIAGLGEAAALAQQEADERNHGCQQFKQRLLAALQPLSPQINGDPARSLPQIVNLSLPDLDGDSVIEATRRLVAISNGAACTTSSPMCSHVLEAMGVDSRRAEGALRFSWSHDTPDPDWPAFVATVNQLRSEVGNYRRVGSAHLNPRGHKNGAAPIASALPLSGGRDAT